ncbi:hypothetical protein vBVpaMR16F_84 [Vibrio phage vB_VpaM_R16F]|nr:hypothetical protein vBVpaMR16F_84 [Vibrio phage vB_VpaM_R16F]
MKTNLVTTVRVCNNHSPLDRINKLCKDINSHEHCNVEAQSVLGETNVFTLKVSSEKDNKLGCTKDGFCYNRKRVLAKSVIDSLLSTPFYCGIETIEEV